MSVQIVNISIVLIILILILITVAIFTNYWNSNSSKILDSTMKSNNGLWQSCSSVSIPALNTSTYNCTSYSKTSAKLPKALLTVKILAISGMVLLLVSAFLLFLAPQKREWCVISIILGGLLSIAAASVWATDKNLKPTGSSFGYSYYLELIGGIIAFLFGLLLQFKVLQ